MSCDITLSKVNLATPQTIIHCLCVSIAEAQLPPDCQKDDIIQGEDHDIPTIEEQGPILSNY